MRFIGMWWLTTNSPLAAGGRIPMKTIHLFPAAYRMEVVHALNFAIDPLA